MRAPWLDEKFLWVLAGAAFAVALVQTARLWWRGAAARWRMGRRLRRALAGEVEAEGLLRRAGYDVVGRQVPGAMAFLVDGRAVEVAVRADLVVERGGRRWVAEVKTGARAPDPAHPPTRRQLLEYRLAFVCDGVLLVDVEARAVREVVFPLPAAPARRVPAWVLALACGAAGAVLARLWG